MAAMTLTPDDVDQMAKGAFRKPGGGERRNGDMRIGEHLMKFRQELGYPRTTVARATGVSVTTITRLELGQRMFSAHSLSGMIVGLRELVELMQPAKKRWYDGWAMELLKIVHTVEEEERIDRRARGQRALTTENGRR